MNQDDSLSSDERGAVRRLADKHGDHQAAEMLGVSIDSLLRVLADRPIRRGTAHLLRSKLTEMKKKEKEART